MTEQQLLPRAGRHLDCLIAEHALGWGNIDLDGCGIDYYGISPNGYWRHCVPHYSTSIVGAWKVVDYLSAQGWRVSISQSEKRKWRCSFYMMLPNKRNSELSGGAWADTVEEAICHAALDAMDALLPATEEDKETEL